LAKLYRQLNFTNLLAAKLFIDDSEIFTKSVLDIFDGFGFGGPL
jgi:hypothetical protein